MKPLQAAWHANRDTAAVARSVSAGVAPPVARTLRTRRIFKTAPQITYTVSKREITPEDLHRLYNLCACDAATPSGSHIRRSHWQHWTHPPDEAVLRKFRMALHNSVAIAAAFTRDPRLTDDGTDDEDEYAIPHSGGSSSSSSGWTSPLLQLGSSLWGQRRPQQLVGFARAAGDYSLVATVHDLAIHPELQGFGIGARLIKKVVTQVNASDIYDVGLVTPQELQPFFQGCSFDLDREESVPMVLRGLSGGGHAESDRVARSSTLKQLLQEI